MTSSVASTWQATALRLPDKVALVCGDTCTSHTQLADQVRVLAGAMKNIGVTAGDKVVLLLDNSIEFVVAMLATLELGAVFVPLSSLTRSAKLGFVMQDTQARMLITQCSLKSVWSVVSEEGRCHQLVEFVLVDVLPKTSDKATLAEQVVTSVEGGPLVFGSDNDTLAAILYTSGTTGQPKGVMLTHANMVASRDTVQSYLGLRENDVIGLALPVAFSYGLYHLIMGLGLGATIVIERNATFPVVMLKSWKRHRVSVFPGVPTLFISLLSQDLSAFDLQSLRIITNAGAALSIEHLNRLRCTFPKTQIFSMYGLTECKRVSYLPPDDLDTRPGSVGRGLPGQRHWLVDENGCEVGADEIGELVVAGPHVMQGYWRRPLETARALRAAPDGTVALFTGDLFRSDAEGYLYFLSRSDNIIMSRGEKVSPLEVEQVITLMPGVIDAAVSGIPDELLGMAVRAHVQLASNAQVSERQVIRHCLSRLESFMVPKRVIFVDKLPVTESGKVHHALLRSSGSDES